MHTRKILSALGIALGAIGTLGRSGLAHAASPPPDVTLGTQVAVAPPDTTYLGLEAVSPVVGTNGTDSLVCWSSGFSSPLACARFTAAGVLLDSPCIVLDPSVTGTPEVAWNGSQYVVYGYEAAQTVDPSTGALGNAYATSPIVATAFGGGEALALSGATATVYDASENVLGQVTLPMATTDEYTAVAAWSNGTFLVAWTGGEDKVLAARISQAGALLDATPIVVDPGSAGTGVAVDGGTEALVSGVAIGASATGFLVTWYDSRTTPGPGSYGARLGTDGTVAGTGGALLVSSDAVQRVAWDGTQWWLVWGAFGATTQIGVEPVAANGTVGEAMFVSTPQAADAMAIAVTSATVFVSWEAETDNGEGSAIAGVRLSRSGSVLDAPPIWQSTHADTEQSPSLTASPQGGYLAAWSEPQPGTIVAARLGADGQSIDAPPLVLGSGAQAVAGWVGGAYLVAWYAYDQDFMYLTRVPASGAPGPTYILPTGTSFEEPQIACAADRCLLTWVVLGSASFTWQAAIVDGEGGQIGPTFPLPITGELSKGIVVAGSSSFLFVYDDQSSTQQYAEAIGFDGAQGTPTPFTNDAPVAVAWGAGRFLVLTQDGYVDRLGANAAVLEPETLTAPAGFAPTASLAWVGSSFFGVGFTTSATPVSASEIAPSGPVSLANEFTVIDAADTTAQLVASAVAGQALVTALVPQGPESTPLLVARPVAFAQPAAGEDGGVDGGGDAGQDAGAPVAIADAGAPPPPDATAIEADGGSVGDASGGSAGGSSGCGCSVPGGGGDEGWAGLLGAIASIAMVAARARRR